jgi:hypothetical protein
VHEVIVVIAVAYDVVVGGLTAISNAAVDVVVVVVVGVVVGAVFAARGAETDAGTGVEARDCAGEGVASLVRRQRSLIISFCGLTTGSCSGGEGSSWDCENMMPLDSSDELSVPSGVESESNNGRGERRFLARGIWSSCSPSTLGLGRFLDSISAVNLTLGVPAWGPAALRTDE